VIPKLVGRAKAQPVLEPRVALWTPLPQHLVERPFEATFGAAPVSAPVAEPHRPGIFGVHGPDDEPHPILGVRVTGDRSRKQVLGFWKVRTCWIKSGNIFEAPPGRYVPSPSRTAFRFSPRAPVAGRNDSLDVKIVGVPRGSAQGLFVVRITTASVSIMMRRR